MHLARFRNVVPRSRVVAALALCGCLSACREAGVLDPRGPIAAAERLILFNATAIMLVVVIPIIALTLGVAWWYRASNTRAVYRPDWSYSGQIELVVWSIPAMVVILLAGVAWIGSHDLDPGRKLNSTVKPLRVQVVSLDWKWLFLYPDLKVASVNRLVVPAGAPLEFELTSATVMNGFFVPQLGTQIYTMPGMSTHLNLLADRAGDYPGLSSHFSGDGFSDMRFSVHAVSAADFERWVGATRGAAPALSESAYLNLTRNSVGVAATSYGDVAPHLYAHIVRMAAPQPPGAASDK